MKGCLTIAGVFLLVAIIIGACSQSGGNNSTTVNANSPSATTNPNWSRKAIGNIHQASLLVGVMSPDQRHAYQIGVEHLQNQHQRLGRYTIQQVANIGQSIITQEQQAEEAQRQAEQAREAAAQEAARRAAAVVLNTSGSGIHSTEEFQVQSEWELQWSYDCSNFDNSGNFIVNVEGDVEDGLVNELGSGGSGTEYVHQGGTVYLKINSECDWSVKAVNEV